MLIEPSERVSFVLNGTPVSCRGDHPHLLAALREELQMLSAKDGCSPSGQCGCCTVLLDGKAQVSCQTSLTKAAGRAITTLEGLPTEERERYARVFASTGALQCGFCTPGIVMRTKALIGKKGADLTRQDAARHLGAHLCRCTGYVKILDAMQLLAAGADVEVPECGGVGTSGLRYEGLELSLGDKPYVDDLLAARHASRRVSSRRARAGRRRPHRRLGGRSGARGRAGADGRGRAGQRCASV